MAPSTLRAAVALPLVASCVNAAYSIANNDDIKTSAAQLAYDTMAYYTGNQSGQTPGILPGPPPAGDYYWWEAGALWGAMVEYWHYTGDATYNDVVTQALLFQVGPNQDYMPPNVTASLGNDDQGFWGMSAMTAAELNFPNPSSDQPQWLALAQAVFNTQADPSRHDSTCNGGLRWQIPLSNNGYDYKNSIANGCFFNLGARLARYTGNQTYADWAVKTWDWVTGVGFMDAQYNIYDGAHVETNCTDINKAQFSYNNAVYLLGAAHMYNFTEDAVWKQRVQDLLDATIKVFFPNNIAYEVSCEQHMTCTTDMLSFKGYDHRWMVQTTQLAPFTHDQIMTVLQTSTEAAIKQCTGGSTGRQCGFQWSSGAFDNSVGAGQQMNVLGAVSSLLVDSGVSAPLTNATGGTSVGNNNAGASSDKFAGSSEPATTGDKAGASILTILILISAAGTFGWMSTGV
ncbi:family 76 glycoside hydrolase [Cryphonectria parasitica EP155]|uniref:Mannan endo-1,6-alpha-mannosidase n=1 Tax=Cryphonectria parasitica (strain ATCC 38755 / EP155) TaxID=660469 RepID=A0A9P5CKC3_CRYP1|nr:family 76 glycoside hydrolase [Cryphonectria parasitica EP155]KAF3760595.1 family 76 glycoside hydrolase [Cryphonectria parasitica EP155]